MGTLAMDASPDLNGNGQLWIIFLWLVAAVCLPFANVKYNRVKNVQFGKQMPAAEKRRLICP